MHLTPVEPSELFQQFFLLGPKIGGGFHHDANELVAASPAAQIDDALSLGAERYSPTAYRQAPSF